MSEEINWHEYFRDYDDGVGTLHPFREHVRKTAQKACLEPGLRVLDTGCGSGQLTRELYEHEQEIEVVGVDLNEAALEYARAKFTSDDPVRFVRVDLNEPDWGVEPGFDRVTSAMVLYALRAPVQYLRTVRSLLRKDGRFVLMNLVDPASVFNIAGLHAEWLATEATSEELRREEEVREARERVITINKRILARTDLFTPSPDHLQELLELSGFAVEYRADCVYGGCACRLVARAC